MNDSNTFTVLGRTFTLAPQTAAILRHLKTVGEISGVEAVAMYRARSLTKRISEINDHLWDSGYLVDSEWRIDSTKQRYKRYHLSDRLREILTVGDARYSGAVARIGG